MPFRHDAGVFRPNGVSRRNFDGLKTPNPVVQLASFNQGSCRRPSPAEDGNRCQMFPRPVSARLLRQQLWRLDQSHLKTCFLRSLSESALTILFSKAGPCPPGPVALWPSFCFSGVFLRLKPPYIWCFWGCFVAKNPLTSTQEVL
jgi:hypothetical protein